MLRPYFLEQAKTALAMTEEKIAGFRNSSLRYSGDVLKKVSNVYCTLRIQKFSEITSSFKNNFNAEYIAKKFFQKSNICRLEIRDYI